MWLNYKKVTKGIGLKLSINIVTIIKSHKSKQVVYKLDKKQTKYKHCFQESP